MLQAAHYEKAKNIEAGMVAIDQALTALTKEKVAKRILRKKLTANQKVAFDDDGNVSPPPFCLPGNRVDLCELLVD